MDDAQRVALERALGRTFDDPNVLAIAFRHASVSDSRQDSNERMEFLGDAILGMIVCERIYQRYPEALEGEMTKIKSLAVSRKVCAKMARSLGLEKHISVGKGMLTADRLPSSLAAAVLESSIAALYIDGGMEAARAFLEPLVDPLIDAAAESGHQHNFKSVLQQHAQQAMGCAPQYVIHAEKGPDHAKAFRIGVELDGVSYEACWGQSKKQAEQQAALNALCELGLIELNGNGDHRMSNGDGPGADSDSD
ncbi:MAG: ribonuclease III [Phycisphaerales bacterium]